MASGAPPISPEGGVGAAHIGVGEATKRLETIAAQTPVEDPIQTAARRAAEQVQRVESAQGPEAALNQTASPSFTSQEMARLQAVKDKFPDGIDQTVEPAPASAGGGIPPPEAPTAVGTQPSGEQNPQIPAETEEEKLASIFERMSPQQLQRKSDNIQRQIASLGRKSDRLTNLSDMDKLQTDIDRLQDQLDIIEDIQEIRGDEIDVLPKADGRERGTGRQTREEKLEERDEARRESQQRLEEYRRLARLSSADLNSEGQTEEAVFKALNKELDTSRGADRDEITKRIRDSEARLEAINNLKESREPEDKTKKQEEETKKSAEEQRRNEEELIGLRAETATSTDLDNFRRTVRNIQNEVSDFESSYAELNEAVAAEVDADRKKQLSAERAEVRSNLLDARRRLKLYENAQRTAESRLAESQGAEAVIGAESVAKMSPAEYSRLSKEEKVARLQELAGALPGLNAYEYVLLEEKIYAGDALSQNEMAQFVRYTSDRLVAGDRSVLQTVYQLNGRYSEIAPTVIAAAAATKEGNKALREAFPSNWEKVLKLAAKNKGLLILLLALLAGVVGAVTAGVGPALAVGAGGAAGAGASSGFRRN
ncbi:hypothetical protein A2870_04165 [Candidatus Curtissbacteria bacterium RIFCSPHIGHO2_01_FULL_41_11]|uniref:Uncharacterized protein n=1 Tax=Candidatus Curtissbacteria bacterium RIFCSPHIGHO2_01_FULL_41_11 TaxID=1797711 RepID=A0A1F5G6L7_9BACT|nr:MAG: hypothetical protein A2870_04165 [Candidatus Curtissbacteria bacterium RIFCSPHIGHO2_01_FULL_41_11]